MTTIEQKISAAFAGGARRCRELRLTGVEIEYVRANYPAQVMDMGENWYEITFMGCAV